MDDLVIYHGNCSDGFCAAWAARKVMPDATFRPANHGQEPPDVTGKNVYCLDFAFKRKVHLELQKKAKSLTVVDHHKTALADLQGIKGCYFDLTKSGATGAWDYFKIKGEMPWIVSYVEDRDLNRWKLPHSHEINAAMDSYPFNFRVWDTLERLYHNPQESPLVKDGKCILRFQDRLIENIVNHSRMVEIDGYRVKAANTSCIFAQVAERLAQTQQFGLAWYLREDGKYVHSLHSRKDSVDVSVIARNHGGGGHPHSAGFETEKMILKEI